MDANIRPWGMIAAPLDLGVDFGAAYAADILGTPLPPSAPSRAGAAPLPVFPHQVFVAAETWRARDGLAAASALVRTFARPLGLPYCAYILARSLLIAARGLRADRRVRRRAARAAETADTASVLAQGSGEAIA